MSDFGTRTTHKYPVAVAIKPLPGDDDSAALLSLKRLETDQTIGTEVSSLAGESDLGPSNHRGSIETQSTGGMAVTPSQWSNLRISKIESRIRPAYAETARNENVESLKMNKLRFSSLGLHGRKRETEVLRACFNRIAPAKLKQEGSGGDSTEEPEAEVNLRQSSSEVVFVSGESGTGKTALAESIKPRVDRCKGIYISGKFDIYLRVPYSGIISAFRELCVEMIQLREQDLTKYQKFCDSILAEVGDEIALLANIVPILEEAIEIPVKPGAVDEQGNKEAKERLKYAFLQFFRVVTGYFDRLVLVLDDLQWADVSSMELLDALIKDKVISLMFIGIYRSNEVDGAHNLSKSIRDLRQAQNSSGFALTEVSIGNLDASICEEILVELLSVDSGIKSRRLAEICHKRTHGNAFHLLAYLAMLQEEKLLKFNLGLFKWTWDPEQIEENTAAASNVVELVKSKMTRQLSVVRDFLHLLSCLGSSFDESIVIHACSKKCADAVVDQNELGEEIKCLLSLAVDEDFLRRQGPLRYRWVHDSVQAAATQLVSKDKMPAFQFKLGKVLLQSLTEKNLDSNVFVVANLLNAAECPESDKLTIAELNLKASKRAVEFSAFESCVSFAERGIALLPSGRWNHHQQVSLELYSLCCEAHLSIGSTDSMHSYGDEVLQQQTLTELEKVRIYHCKISSLGGGRKSSEALALSLDVLGKLGCKFPRSSAGQAVKALASLRNTKLPKMGIKGLATMVDETKKACMVLMMNAATYAHYCNDPFAMVMAVARMVRWTIKHGVDASSAAAFALFGFVKVQVSGAYKLGNQFAELGLQMLGNLEDKTPESRVMYLAWWMVAPRVKPIHSSLKYLLAGYRVGMEVGDAESAMWNVCTYITGSVLTGRPLKALAVDCKTYLEQMDMLNQEQIRNISLPIWQGVLNMLGDAKDPLLLTGSAMNEGDWLVKIEQTESALQSYLHLQIMKSMMCSFFGDFETGAKLAFQRGDDFEKTNGSPFGILDVFHRGIALYAMARKTKEKKYIKAANKAKSTVSSWAKQGNVNVIHYLPFFGAEEAALKGKSDNAIRLYEQAVSQASRSGFQHNAALASERFGEYLLHDVKDNERAVRHFQNAANAYSAWGSDYKADLLKSKYSHLRQNSIPFEIEAFNE